MSQPIYVSRVRERKKKKKKKKFGKERSERSLEFGLLKREQIQKAEWNLKVNSRRVVFVVDFAATNYEHMDSGNHEITN